MVAMNTCDGKWMLLGLLIPLIIMSPDVRMSFDFIWQDKDIPVEMEFMQLPTGPNDFVLSCLDRELWFAFVDCMRSFSSSMIRLV